MRIEYNYVGLEIGGVQYDHEYPPPRQFQNAKNCEQFVGYINPPDIVSPITIEPTKPRLWLVAFSRCQMCVIFPPIFCSPYLIYIGTLGY
jgi:hypothetical protein